MDAEAVAKEDPGTPSAQSRAIWRAGKWAVLGYVLIVANVVTVILGTASANRPHEVRGETFFFILIGAHVVVCLLVLLALLTAWRVRGSKAFRAIHLLPLVLAVGYACLVLAFFGRIGWSWIA